MKKSPTERITLRIIVSAGECNDFSYSDYSFEKYNELLKG